MQYIWNWVVQSINMVSTILCVMCMHAKWFKILQLYFDGYILLIAWLIYGFSFQTVFKTYKLFIVFREKYIIFGILW